MFKIKIYLILISIWINLVKLENNQTNIDYNLINQSDEKLNLKNDDTISQFTFNDKNLDYSLLNRYILENNHIFIDDNQQIKQQNDNQIDYRSKVYSFKPKQIMDTIESNDELYQNYLNLPTKSTLEKSFPKLYRQLYNLDKASLQKNLHQFFRSGIDNLSTIKQFNDTIKSIDAERIKISTKNLQTLSLDKTNSIDRNKISTDTIRFESIDTIIENKTATLNNDKINNSIKTESSNKNESLIKIDLLNGYLNNKLNLTKDGKRLTYDDLKNLNPIEFKFIKLDKNKFNNKRYIPKIIYSKMKTKKFKKLTKQDNQEIDQQTNENNQFKIIPISYILDDNLLLNPILDNTINKQNTNYLTSSTDTLIDNYQFNNLNRIYNLNNFDLIGTLIDNLIQNLPNNLPNNLLNLSNDLSFNLPDNQQLNGLLISNNVNKRSTNLLNNKKRNEKQLNIVEIKEFIDQQDKQIKKLNKKENSKKIELQKNKFRSFLNSLIKLDLIKLDNLNNYLFSKYDTNLNKINFNKPNCFEISNSTICFTGIKNND